MSFQEILKIITCSLWLVVYSIFSEKPAQLRKRQHLIIDNSAQQEKTGKLI
jgi:hypothetical protein